MTWTRVCALAELVPELGVAALVDGHQVALFRLPDGEVLAVQQRDPYSGANVVSRGIVGTAGERLTISSPMLKQVWDLRTGECVDPGGKDLRPLATYLVEISGGDVLVDVPAVPA